MPPESPTKKKYTRRSLPMAMTIKEAVDIAGTLGHPSKMPGYSYGISAQKCITGSKLRTVPGSVCASCYALTDWYRSWEPLLYGHQRRYEGLFHPRWADAMVRMIDAAYASAEPGERYFRWHDAGDIQGRWHLVRIVEVCERTPTITHWLPTREYQIVAAFLASGKSFPPNLTVRLSAHMIDSEPVIPPAFAGAIKHLPVSTVSSVPLQRLGLQIVEGKGSVECRAVEVRDNKCGNCRACWDPRVRSVNYPAH
jgi:hypothetical protein